MAIFMPRDGSVRRQVGYTWLRARASRVLRSDYMLTSADCRLTGILQMRCLQNGVLPKVQEAKEYWQLELQMAQWEPRDGRLCYQ